ncbi:MAG: hypothetical protein A2V83_11230 [Nitrospirae bacterium RBG_16_64_22]|nr:MAG: hypothetical protein A2V83_11230 [Nitrospirae bacterium RBG_16_64_22]
MTFGAIVRLATTLPLVFCVLTAGRAGADNDSSRSTRSITVGGAQRTYLLHALPPQDRTGLAPLVIVLHGGGGTAERMVRLTNGGLSRLAEREGFIVAYPNGIDKHWNDGRGADETGWRAQGENVDDVGFVSALIEELVKTQNADPRRVYVTGVSNGGQMAHRLACEISGKIAAIAPVIAQMPAYFSPRCKPARPVSVLMMPGTKDPLVPWEGGTIRLGRRTFGRVLSAAETVAFWTRRNACPAPPETSWEPDRDPSDGTRVRKEAYRGCGNGAEVVLYAIEGGGHTWPGGRQYLPESIVGKVSRDIDAAGVMWEFFKKHRRD